MLPQIFSWRQSLVFRDLFIKYLFFAAGAGNIASWAIMLWAYFVKFGFKDFLVLHSTVYFGIDLAGPKYRIFFYPLFGTAVLLANAFIVGRWGKRNVFLARGTAMVDIVILAVLLAASIMLVNLNLQ